MQRGRPGYWKENQQEEIRQESQSTYEAKFGISAGNSRPHWVLGYITE